MNLVKEGQIIRGTYEVERLLGEGAFAQVYRVKHRFLGRQAMKVFKMVGMTIEETEEVLGEALILSRFGHPNIVRVFDANTTETTSGMSGFFTMEYVAGGTLEKFWRSHGLRLVSVETTVDIICQVCRGLAIAHSERPPIVHRDVKPQNILVGYDATGIRARLSDFGLAKHVNPLTLLASAAGTRAFKAPEVFQDYKSDSCAGDVWGLGCTLYLLLTDRLPHANAKDIHSLDPGRFDRPISPPSLCNAQVDDALDKIVLRSLAKDPGDRYQNASSLLEDLAAWRPRVPKAKVHFNTTESWEMSKCALGIGSSHSETEARQMARRALDLSRQAQTLNEAADLMEEAFNAWPELRGEYEARVQLWRRGICM